MMVLGGGLSGVSAALRSAELGGRVCLIEKRKLGELGFRRRRALFIKNDKSFNLSWEKYKNELIVEAGKYSKFLEKKLSDAGVEVVEGEGQLASQKEISVQVGDGEHLLLKGKSIILAYGSDCRFSPTLPHEEKVVVSIDEISGLSDLPEKVLITGGGHFAAEAALGLQKRGCKVFLCFEQKMLFPQLDEDFNKAVESQFKTKKIKVLPGKKIISIYKNAGEIEITLESGIKFSVNQIIIAEGRAGMPENDVAEKLGVRLGEHKNILVDDAMMTSLPGVFAVGSVTGELTSDTLSREEGRIAAENAMGKKRQLNREWVPYTIRTVPCIAYAGCSMKTAPLQGFHPVEGNFEEKLEDTEGSSVVQKFKVIADKRSRLVVGVQLISSNAVDWVPMLLLLIKKGVTVSNLSNFTSSEGAKINSISEAARDCLKALKTP